MSEDNVTKSLSAPNSQGSPTSSKLRIQNEKNLIFTCSEQVQNQNYFPINHGLLTQDKQLYGTEMFLSN